VLSSAAGGALAVKVSVTAVAAPLSVGTAPGGAAALMGAPAGAVVASTGVCLCVGGGSGREILPTAEERIIGADGQQHGIAPRA
jgi:hypothetical protein